MFGMVVEELNRLWMQQRRTPCLLENLEFREVWNYILYYANEKLLEKPVGSTMKIGNALITHIPRSLSANLSPMEDGHIEYNGYTTTYTKRATANIMGMYAYYNWFENRAYVEWDVSSISDVAVIIDTGFKYHCYRKGFTPNVIYEMLGARPSISTAIAVFAEAGEGTAYASPAIFPEVGNNQQVDLGASADADLQASLVADWFAIGMSGGGYFGAIYTEEYAEADPPPTLYLEYELPGPPTPPGSTETATQAVPSGSRHIEPPFYPYTTSLITDRILRHVTKRVRG